MEVYSYEGKKEEEVLAKALEDLNVKEEEILYHKEIKKGSLFKSNTTKFTIAKIEEVANSLKEFLNNPNLKK